MRHEVCQYVIKQFKKIQLILANYQLYSVCRFLKWISKTVVFNTTMVYIILDDLYPDDFGNILFPVSGKIPTFLHPGGGFP